MAAGGVYLTQVQVQFPDAAVINPLLHCADIVHIYAPGGYDGVVNVLLPDNQLQIGKGVNISTCHEVVRVSFRKRGQ